MSPSTRLTIDPSAPRIAIDRSATICITLSRSSPAAAIACWVPRISDSRCSLSGCVPGTAHPSLRTRSAHSA
jgi:hypothetical protein